MPRHGLAGSKTQSADHRGSAMNGISSVPWSDPLVGPNEFDFNDTCFARHRNYDSR